MSSKIFIPPLQKNTSENRLENNSTKTLSSKGSIHQPQKKPLPIISITCHTETATKLLKNSLTILQKHHLCEPSKKLVIRCLKCQLFGHIAKHCTEEPLCHLCGGKKHPNKNCMNRIFCVNCKKEGHPSTSRECPIFLLRTSAINKQ